MAEQQEDQHVTLNIGGKHFTTYRTTLTKYPQTLLGRMFADDQKLGHQKIPFFDRSDLLFDAILNFYRTDLLIKPDNIPKEVWQAELGFWGLPEEESSPDLKDEMASMKEDVKKINAKVGQVMEGMKAVNSNLNLLLEVYLRHENVDIEKYGFSEY